MNICDKLDAPSAVAYGTMLLTAITKNRGIFGVFDRDLFLYNASKIRPIIEESYNTLSSPVADIARLATVLYSCNVLRFK